MLLYLLFWYLPGVVSCLLLCLVCQRAIDIGDVVNALLTSILMGVFWAMILIFAIHIEYGDKIISKLKK